MPTKPISDRQRLITYASQCEREQLSEAIETFQAIFAGRFPREPRKQARGQKRGSKKVAVEQPELPAMPEEVSDEAPANGKHTRRKAEKFVPAAHMVAAIEENKQNRVEADMLED